MKISRYRNSSNFYDKFFDTRVQKISIDAGFTCPNRDGTRGRGGCTYCLNDAFTPFYTTPQKSIKQQLKEGIDFFSRKYKTWKYLAYFQAYSNTYAPLTVLKQRYEEALSVEGVEGLVIATRPDCIDEEKLEYLAELNKKYFILIEYGVESTENTTLERINRGHTYEEAVWAIEKTAQYGILQGVHMILGLPGEDRQTILNHAQKLSQLPIDLLKLHHLQIIKGTAMAKDYARNPQDYHLFSVDEYVDLVVEFLEHLSPKIVVERFTNEAPPDFLIAPKWGGLKNYHVVHKIEKELQRRNTWQGCRAGTGT